MRRRHDHQRLAVVHINYCRLFCIAGSALSQFTARGSFSFQTEHVDTSNNWYSPSRSIIRTAWLTTDATAIAGYVSADNVAHHSSGKIIADTYFLILQGNVFINHLYRNDIWEKQK